MHTHAFPFGIFIALVGAAKLFVSICFFSSPLSPLASAAYTVPPPSPRVSSFIFVTNSTPTNGTFPLFFAVCPGSTR